MTTTHRARSASRPRSTQAVLDIGNAARSLGRAGVPASVIEGFEFGPLIRAKDATGPDDADGVRRITTEILTSLEMLST